MQMARKGEKVETKLQVTQQGYATRAEKLEERVQFAISEYQKISIELGIAVRCSSSFTVSPLPYSHLTNLLSVISYRVL